jgi:predicted Zn-dependent protease
MANVMLGTQFYKTARLNRYGQRAEVDADLAALTYMLNAGYNPVGMLTFLEHLAERPDLIEWGILQTHPYTRDRVAAVKARLLDLGVQINRRAVTTAFTARTRRSETSFEVLVGDRFVCRLTEEAQARMAAERINALLDAGLQIRDIRVSGSAVIARGEAAFEITPDDAALASKPQEQVAASAADALRHVIFAQMVRDLW